MRQRGGGADPGRAHGRLRLERSDQVTERSSGDAWSPRRGRKSSEP